MARLKPLRRGGLALLSIAVSLLLAEAMVRLLAAAPELRPIRITGDKTVYKRSSNPVLGFELKASWTDPQADLFESLPATNSHGQRDVERSLSAADGVHRVLMLGDSVVEGAGLRKLDDTLSRQLEKRYPDGRTEVLNFGISGYCTLAEVELLRVRGLRFSPDVVLLVFVLNDFDNFNPEAWQLGQAPRPAVAETLFVRSHLFRMAATRLDWFQFGPNPDPVGRNKEAIGDNNVVLGLERLAELSRKHGFEVRIVIWPLLEDERVVDPKPMPSEGDELVIERLARSHGFATMRVSDAFRAHAKAAGEPVNPRIRYSQGDRVHPSPEGSAIAAAAMAEFLARPKAELAATRPDEQAIAAAAAYGGNRPDYARVHYNEGRKLHMKGDLEGAVAAYMRALKPELDPYDSGAFRRRVDVHNNMGMALTDLKRLDEADATLKLAIAMQPDDARLYANLASVRMAQSRPDKAEASLQTAARLAPELLIVRRRLAFLMARRGDGEGAIAHLRAIIALKPQAADAHYQLSVTLDAMGRKEEARAAAEQANRLQQAQ